MNKIIKKFNLIFVLFILSMTGCGLELQKDFEYESSVLDPHVNMTAWEYLQTRPDMFSIYSDAIEYAEMKDYFTQKEKKYTFLALSDVALKTYMMDRFPGAQKIEECDKETVKKMLLYHIVDGEYSSYGDLMVEPMFVLTLLRGEEGLMTMLTRKNPWQADAGKVVVNNTGSNGSSPMRLAVTSNIMPTNGVIHVFDSYCYYKK